MKLSVIILNYNVRHFLELCIKSVEAALTSIDAEIIVVDNLSKDDSCEMVKRQFPKVKLIENSKNYGFSKGNNIAVKEAKGDYLCILNPDTVVAEDTFELLLKISEANKNPGIIGCRLIDGKGQFLPESKRKIPTPSVAIKKIIGLTSSYYANDINETSTGLAPVFVGAFMLLKTSVYKQVKGFDEDYFMYGEDIDLSYKVRQAGYNNMYVGATTAIHYKGESTLKDKTYAKRFYGAMQIFYNKHFKSNIVFDAMVWLGIRCAPLFQKSIPNTSSSNRKLVLISSEMNTHLENAINQPLVLQSNIAQYDDDTEYILDNNHLSFKSIIEIISKTPKNSSATFKILPKNSNFIIGSNSSKSRGSIINFDDN
ncbi:glycosyltransferase family 2 protein [Psychroserpens damuponensis]|uniref:glycosyltransferase family 2 protein n=1 Tax=Psychroserpens damuponensis TaxID=943936 RepID=UPI0005906947|nr:glycosyltransferase family 2 protein [Psychroserpens damuponensis]